MQNLNGSIALLVGYTGLGGTMTKARMHYICAVIDSTVR